MSNDKIEAKALELYPETTGYPLDPCTDRERSAFIKGCQYAATPPASGLQWAKASERLPDPESTVVARDIDTLNYVDQWDIYKMDQDHLEAIEWLDESSPAQPGYSEQQVREAIVWAQQQEFIEHMDRMEHSWSADEIIELLNNPL